MGVCFEFPITVYSELKPLSSTLSLSRCRVFYKGLNRNGSYITDEFAERLVKTLPYAPVKGIYDNEANDYTDHGERRDLGRIYGVVPVDNNFAWETHMDSDGVARIYACTDVILYTALYEEASDIVGKAQSMELYEPSIKGDWEIRNGQRCYVFSDGCFLGLQVLGDDTEPCFEGSSFFKLKDNLEAIVKQMEKFAFLTKREDKQMDKLNFKLSDGQKLYNVSEGKYIRAYYTKDDETDSVKIDKTEDCFIVDVTSEEKAALDTLQALKGTYAAAVTEFNSLKEGKETAEKTLIDEKNNFSQLQETLNTQISDYEIKINTLETEKETFSAQIHDLVADKEALSGQIEELQNYKLSVETKEKKDIISSYVDKLSEEKIAEYTAKIDEYTDTTALKKDLAFELVENNPNLFDKKEEARIPNGLEEPTGVEAILAKYAGKKKS